MAGLRREPAGPRCTEFFPVRSGFPAAVVVRASFVLSALLAGSHAAAAATTPIKVMTYNTHHGGMIWAKDNYHVARATLRMAVELADGTQVNVFVCHLPALLNGATARMTYVNTFKTWRNRSRARSWSAVTSTSPPRLPRPR